MKQIAYCEVSCVVLSLRMVSSQICTKFVTHSPFILSDITRNDILCIENGIQVDLKFQTFGANIHDLLRHPFFMKNGTIGDYAQKIINEIIVLLSVQLSQVSLTLYLLGVKRS